MLPAGHVFPGPDGQGYRLTRDLGLYDDPKKPDLFEAFGGAPEPRRYERMPRWLLEQLELIRKLSRSVKVRIGKASYGVTTGVK